MFSLQHYFIASLLALLVAGAAYFFKSLRVSGALAAFVLGSVVFGLGGIDWAVILIVFFVTSSGLSLLFRNRKQKVEEKFSKGSRRDAGQVIANGGIAGVMVLFHLAYPQSALPWTAFCASLAAANADTWATELGVLSSIPPRLINNWKPVPAGTSGGISMVGTSAAILGSLIIALACLLCWPLTGLAADLRWLATGVVLLSGLVGSLVDSLLGATLQAIYRCPTCDKETEKHPLHTCGTPTQHLRGLTWLNNDWVNLLCTASAAFLSIIIFSLVR